LLLKVLQAFSQAELPIAAAVGADAPGAAQPLLLLMVVYLRQL
jgi:hypothetical protein